MKRFGTKLVEVGACLAILALVAGCAAQGAAPEGDARPGGSAGTTLSDLRGGGYVLYFRHASTDRLGQPDDDLSTCKTQRNLNEEGRAESREIGRAFEELGIPVGEVVASPYCRAQDTARLAFGRTEVDHGILEADQLEEILSVPPQEGGDNRVVVGHGMPFSEAAGLSLPDEGEAVVLDPRGEEGFEEVGRFGPEEWASLEGDG